MHRLQQQQQHVGENETAKGNSGQKGPYEEEEEEEEVVEEEEEEEEEETSTTFKKKKKNVLPCLAVCALRPPVGVAERPLAALLARGGLVPAGEPP